MGVYSEEFIKPLHDTVILGKADYSNDTQRKLFPPLKKYKAVYILIVVFLLVITGLIAALIVSRRLRSHDLNNEKIENSCSCSLPGKSTDDGSTYEKSTDDRTTTKNQYSAPCEDDWIWYRGKCYYFSTIYDTWSNSQEFCKSHDASLALIDNKQELDFMFRYKGKDSHWIGLRRTDNNKAWIWTNGNIYNGTILILNRPSPANIEYAYLNDVLVSSQAGGLKTKWICNTS